MAVKAMPSVNKYVLHERQSILVFACCNDVCCGAAAFLCVASGFASSNRVRCGGDSCAFAVYYQLGEFYRKRNGGKRIKASM